MNKNERKIKKAEKRKIEQLHRKKRMQKIVSIFVIVIAVASIAVLIGVSMGDNGNLQQEKPTESEIKEMSKDIQIPKSEISSDATFYSYDSNGVDIRFFIVEGSDGEYHSAFDACDVCYLENMGYKQDGYVVNCINCGLTFPINDIGEKNTGGGCWPSYLQIKTDKNNIIIEKSDLENKRYMFP